MEIFLGVFLGWLICTLAMPWMARIHRREKIQGFYYGLGLMIFWPVLVPLLLITLYVEKASGYKMPEG